MADQNELEHLMDALSDDERTPVIECYCMCHTYEDVRHCMPCCHPCGYCGMRIKYGVEQHYIDYHHRWERQ